MQCRWIVTLLGLLTVLLLAGLLACAPATPAASEQGVETEQVSTVAASPQEGPTNTPDPTPTPDATPTNAPPTPRPLTQAEFEEFVESLCHNIEFMDPNAHHYGGGRVRIEWSVSGYTGPHQGPHYAGYELVYRIHRRVHQDNDVPWVEVADVNGQTTWEGQEPPGDWNYRVHLLAVMHQGMTRKCLGAITIYFVVHLPVLVSPEDVTNFAKDQCERLEIIGLVGETTPETVMLNWVTNERILPPVQQAFGDYAPNFGVERSHGSGPWTPEKVTMPQATWWEGPAIPGRTLYRVTLLSITVGEQTFPCQGVLSRAEVLIVTPTLQARAEREREQAILAAEATRCAQEALTGNISAEALPAVNKFVDRLVARAVDRNTGSETNDGLVRFVVTLCASASGDEGAVALWSLLQLLDYGF